MNDSEKPAWESFQNVSQNFLSNNKSENYENLVGGLSENFKNLGCLMNLKLHFLHPHFDYIPQNLGDYNEEQGERFHQDTSEMENQGRWNVNMMADFCWTLKREITRENGKRKRHCIEHSKKKEFDTSEEQCKINEADTSSQYDAIRAYLKELDITENIWIGLSKTPERPGFTWTNFQPLTGDGHFQEAIPVSTAPMCVSMDPAADFLWKSFACGGPEVASFICELPIPSWALGSRGCLLTELPSLTVLYIPEQSALELTSDCGLDGTKRIACKGNADREEILKQLTCTISHEDFDEKTTKSPIASSTVYESYSDENSPNSKTTKTWIWTSNTVDIDYGMPTRHRRETEDTLSPISTKSTAALSTTKESYQKKLITTEIFTTSATNYDTEVTSSLENESTFDSKGSKSSDKSTGLNEMGENLSTQNVNVHSEIHAFSTPAFDSQNTQNPIDDTAIEYPSAINQGQLFSIIENGTMFDFIELNDTNANADAKPVQETYATQGTIFTSVKPTQNPPINAKNKKVVTNTNLSIKGEKPTKNDIYKYSDPKKFNKNSSKDGIIRDNQMQEFTKEVELFPIIKDSSIKLNRTFRKELPPLSVENNSLIKDNKFEEIDLSVNNELSDPIAQHIEIKLEHGGKHNITKTLYISTAMRKHFGNEKLPADPSKVENIEALQKNKSTFEKIIHSKTDVLINNKTKNNESDVSYNKVLAKNVTPIPEISLTKMKKQFLPKSLLGEIETVNNPTNNEEQETTQDPLEIEPEEQPRPNRQRQLTRPQRRSFYPYFFSRVLG